MLPHVKVDEDLPEVVAELFPAAGYPATTVRAQGWSGLEDAPLWARIQAEARWLVTADKGFGDIRTYVPGNRDREKPHSSPLPHHLAYGSVPRRFGVVTCCGEHLIGLTPSDQRVDC